MKKPKQTDLVLLDNVRAQIVFPHTGTAVTERSLLRYMDQLELKTVLLKVDGVGQLRRHVTTAQAQQLVALFKAKHWRKFRAAEPKRKGE